MLKAFSGHHSILHDQMPDILFAVDSAKTSLDQFYDRLRDLADGRNKLESSSILLQLDNSRIRQCVVAPGHLAFLLEDGRICRVPFQVNIDKVDINNKDTSAEDVAGGPSKTASVLVHSGASSSRHDHPFTISGEALSTLSGHLGRWGSPRNASGTVSANRPSSGATAGTGRGRARIVRAARGRPGGSWVGARAVVPVSAVPEELISQAQVVLQGKSRNIIIRELQRTNLDVNLAVNNLLSRDDDDPDDQDDASDSYIPGDDLISIFESGIAGDESSFVVDPESIFPEDIIYGTSMRPGSRGGNRAGSADRESDRDRDREGTAGGSSRPSERWWGVLNLEPGSKPSKVVKGNTKPKDSSASEPVQIVGDLEFWYAEPTGNENEVKFIKMASMYSELVAISSDGRLHQWKWNDSVPYRIRTGEHSHPRRNQLKLTGEKIVNIAASNVRATVLTESGKLATWLDDTLTAVSYKLEHVAQTFPELKNQQITSLHACDLYSCVQVGNGAIFWWGVFPFDQRKKLLDKVKQKAKKSAISGSALIHPGTQVCLRSCPLYYSGAVGFITSTGEPKVGELMEQAWTITEKCRFKILKKWNKDEKDSGTEKEDKEDYHQPSGFTKKRKRSGDVDEMEERKREEQWSLKDVIFVEDVRNVPVGRVLKVDGAYALVSFSAKDYLNDDNERTEAFQKVLQQCRLVRKDELQTVKWSTPPKMPECFQKSPKQLSIPNNNKVLSMALDIKGVHTLLKSANGLRYTTFNLASGRPELGGTIPVEPAAFLSSSLSKTPSLITAGMGSPLILRDGNGCVFPITKNNNGVIKDPHWVNLPPITCLAMGSQIVENTANKTHAIVTVMIIEEQQLMHCITTSDIDGIRMCLKSIEGDQKLINTTLTEKCDGNRNILHRCVSLCHPKLTKQKGFDQTTKASDAESSARADLVKSLELTRRPSPPSRDLADIALLDVAIPTTSWPPEILVDNNPQQEVNKDSKTMWIPIGERSNGLNCLNTLLKAPILEKYILHLLTERDASGCTPFMAAICGRAYLAASTLMDTAYMLATKEEHLDVDLFMSMISPVGIEADKSPLHALCCNDTCSFTWTGTRHINQDIFECRTCGLVGSLCCCTECARVCHVGHDCKLKRTSPTAYCDCWEKCACKALIPGEQKVRLEILQRIVKETNLTTKPNKRGEHILLFLALTVARQGTEQGQYIPSTSRTSDSRPRSAPAKIRGGPGTPPLPDHDLEPPKFAKTALELILKDWNAVRSMIMFGSKSGKDKTRSPTDDDENFANLLGSSILSSDEREKYLNSQEGTSRLDNFTHCLIIKCSAEYLEILLRTFENALEAGRKSQQEQETVEVAKRFVRSVCRICVILTACMASNSTKRKGGTSAMVQIVKCRKVFASLNVLAAKELASMADAIFAPVRMGVVYPSAPFALASMPNDVSQATEDLFSTPPLPSRIQDSNFSNVQRVRFEESARGTRDNERRRRRQSSVDMEIGIEASGSQSIAAESQDDLNIDNETEGSHAAESDMELDLLAESESDSDESNAGEIDEGQRNEPGPSASRVLRAAATLSGVSRSNDNDNVDYYTEEESIAEGDEEEEEEEEEDENDNNVEQTEQVPNSGQSNSAPHALQWAVRNSRGGVTTSTATAHTAAGSGLIYIDAANLRRSGSAGASASADIANNAGNMFCTPSALARTFSIVVRELSDVLSLTSTSPLLQNVCIPLDQVVLQDASRFADSVLQSSWEWLWKVMEATEAQLRFGASLTAVSDPSHPNHPFHDTHMKNKGDKRNREDGSLLANWNAENRRKRRPAAPSVTTSSNNLRQDFLEYILSLMRGHENEHADSLPKLEITSLRHVAYLLDAFVYYLRSKSNKKAATVITAQVEPTIDAFTKKDPHGTDKDPHGTNKDPHGTNKDPHGTNKDPHGTNKDTHGTKKDPHGTNKDPQRTNKDPHGTNKDHDSQQKSEEDEEASCYSGYETDPVDDEPEDPRLRTRKIQDTSKETRHSFFKRTDSTFALGYEPADPFTAPIREALPLADKPHFLNPNARRDNLFGFANQPDEDTCLSIPQHMSLGVKSECALAGQPEKEPRSTRASKLLPPSSQLSPNFVLGRWRMCLELFGRVFLDDVGTEPSSILNELGRFDVKEAKFRREMEKLRNGHQKDLYLEGLERDRASLIQQTLRQLNGYFGRTGLNAGPLNIHRLKVSFQDEPGEGSGVVRSFYTAIGEALLADEHLPPLDSIFSGSKDESHVGLLLLAGLTQRLKARVRERERERRSLGTQGSGTSSNQATHARARREREHARQIMEREGRQRLSIDAKPFMFDPENADASDNEEGDEPFPLHKRVMGRRLYTRIQALQPSLASKITGMLLELTPTQLILMLTHDETLKDRVLEAVELLTGTSSCKSPGHDGPSSSSALDVAGGEKEPGGEKETMAIDDESEDYLDTSPLFFQPGKAGFYSPRPGKNSSEERLNCFRNVGRLVGLCLLQNELCPMSFNRHVIKYLLGKEIRWHDLAFFDPTLYESLRQLIQDSKRSDADELFRGLDLTFNVELCPEEGGILVDLIKNGSNVPVTVENVQNYVKHYAEYRMLKVAKKPLQYMRCGLLDVLPLHVMDGLTSEDFRLLLNGSGDINVQQLMSYTTFSDETGGDSQDKLSKFKRWFWSIVENMTPKQKQDLLYFWTSSPAMPASSEGFQPVPSVTVKPANDHQLPTANTCISRLYIPLYSSKSIIRSKVLLAIKTKTFGFV